MKKQLMIFDFVCLGIGAIFLTFVAILQNCGINITNGSVIGIVITVQFHFHRRKTSEM